MKTARKYKRRITIFAHVTVETHIVSSYCKSILLYTRLKHSFVIDVSFIRVGLLLFVYVDFGLCVVVNNVFEKILRRNKTVIKTELKTIIT